MQLSFDENLDFGLTGAVSKCPNPARDLVMGLAHAKPTAEMTSAAKSFVDSLLNSHKVVVFSKSYCPYCHKAKSALNSMGLAPGAMEWVEIENRPDCDAIQDYMKVCYFTG